MHSILMDPRVDDSMRRKLLYAGQLIVYSPTPASLALCELARNLSIEVFAPHAPPDAQHRLSVEEYAGVLARLKPGFIHHPRCKELIPQMLRELGADPAETYFDVPRLRTATSDSYLTSGLAYAFHPHRDTWYSAPQCQINWWLPVYDIVPENCMAFHPRYWSQRVKNSSRTYNYYRWNKESRAAAASQIKTDTRVQPKAEEQIELDPQLRVICPIGGIIAFSAAHLHSTVPNSSGVTRFSVDFRTVHGGDVRGGIGAPNIDSECTGTSLRDFLRGTDLARLDEAWVRPYDTEPPADDAVLVYKPK